MFHSTQLSKIFPRLSVNYQPFLLPIRRKDIRKFAKWQDDLERTRYLRNDTLDKVLVAQASQWLVSPKSFRKERSVLSLASTLG